MRGHTAALPSTSPSILRHSSCNPPQPLVQRRVRFSRLKVVAEIVETEEWRERYQPRSKVAQVELIQELEALCITKEEDERMKETILNTAQNRSTDSQDDSYPEICFSEPENADPLTDSEELPIEDDSDLRALRPMNQARFCNICMAFADREISPSVEYPNDLVMRSIGSGRARLVVPVVLHHAQAADVMGDAVNMEWRE